MKKNLLSGAHLNDETAAYHHLAQIRWPEGPVCVHCQSKKIYTLKVAGTSKRVVLKCATCRKQFSATVGTIFERSHIPLNKWFMAFQLMASSKKGMSAHQLHRMLDLTYKSAWFLAHRIRHVMTQTPFGDKLGGIVEADETYIGGKAKRGKHMKKTPVFALVERQGRVRSFVLPNVTSKNLREIIRENVAPETRMMTDEFKGYRGLKHEFADHQTINHSRKHYVRGEVTTNTIEGYFSLLKRGLTGTYHHVSKHHLHRYVAEFDFRYNSRKEDDATRAFLAVRQIEGKRLHYR